MPIGTYKDLSDFKLYMSENHMAQVLFCNGFSSHYWKNEDKAEVGFVLQLNDKVIPVEVKKGFRTKSVSMKMFMKKYDSPYVIRISRKISVMRTR